MAERMVDRIPFTVIGGFLGAGKTTLLNRWLQAAHGQRLAVLVNDFGAINLDAAAVAQAGADTIALSNGCVCCTIGDDLSAALGRVLAAQPPFDAVVVEASGVSDPWRIAQYALAEPRLQLHGVVLLVDAAALASHLADPLLADTLQRPLAHADLVVLNHADRASAAQLAAAAQWVAQDAAARGAAPPPVVCSTQAELPGALLSAALYQPHGGGLSTGTADHGQAFEAWQHQPTGNFDLARLRAWLHRLPSGVLRLKGRLPLADPIARCTTAATAAPAAPANPANPADTAAPACRSASEPGDWVDLHFAGRHATLRRGPARPHDSAAVVAIGLAGQLPTQALAAGLAACETTPAQQRAAED
jgi:G3E family GTPase